MKIKALIFLCLLPFMAALADSTNKVVKTVTTYDASSPIVSLGTNVFNSGKTIFTNNVDGAGLIVYSEDPNNPGRATIVMWPSNDTAHPGQIFVDGGDNMQFYSPGTGIPTYMLIGPNGFGVNTLNGGGSISFTTPYQIQMRGPTWVYDSLFVTNGATITGGNLSVTNGNLGISNGNLTVSGTGTFSGQAYGPTPTATNSLVTKAYADALVGSIVPLYLNTNANVYSNSWYSMSSTLVTNNTLITTNLNGIAAGNYIGKWLISPSNGVTQIRDGAALINLKLFFTGTGGPALSVHPELYMLYANGAAPEMYPDGSQIILVNGQTNVYTSSISCTNALFGSTNLGLFLALKIDSINGGTRSLTTLMGQDNLSVVRMPTLASSVSSSSESVTNNYEAFSNTVVIASSTNLGSGFVSNFTAGTVLVLGAQTNLGTRTTITTNNITGVKGIGDINSYFQWELQNTNKGTSASCDFIAEADTGTESTLYGDFGINNSTYADSTYGNTGPLDVYLYSAASNLVLGTALPGCNIKFHTYGTRDTNVVAFINDTSLWVTNKSQGGVFARRVSSIEVDQTYAGTAMTIDWSQGANQVVTLTNNPVISFTGMKAGDGLNLFISTGTGPFTNSWGTAITWLGNATFTNSSVSTTDCVAFKYVAGTIYGTPVGSGGIGGGSGGGGSGNAVNTWTNITVATGTISSASATNAITLFALPASNIVYGVVIGGSSIGLTNTDDDVVCGVGTSDNAYRFTGGSAESVTNSPAWSHQNFDLVSLSAATNVIATFSRSSTNTTFRPLYDVNSGSTVISILYGKVGGQ